MSDLTVLYITANRMPLAWQQFHLGHLRQAIHGLPVISSSRVPVDVGWNLVQEGPVNYSTIYLEMLRMTALAKTPYVAVAEDDVLYAKEHFTEFRPPKDAVAYNRSRWSLYTWNPVFHLKNRLSNATLIAPREYLIDALEERNRRYPEGVPHELCGEVGRWRVERRLGVGRREAVEFWSTKPLVHLHHPSGCDNGDFGGQRKTYGQIQAYDIPYWGRASDLVSKFTEAG